MLNALISILIIAIVAAGCYYAALKYVELKHNRDMLADEYKRAAEHIAELEARVMMLEAERDTRDARMGSMRTGETTGWESFEVRR